MAARSHPPNLLSLPTPPGTHQQHSLCCASLPPRVPGGHPARGLDRTVLNLQEYLWVDKGAAVSSASGAQREHQQGTRQRVTKGAPVGHQGRRISRASREHQLGIEGAPAGHRGRTSWAPREQSLHKRVKEAFVEGSSFRPPSD